MDHEHDHEHEHSWPGEALFCQRCGTPLERRSLHGHERGVCPSCGRIDFRSPSVGVAVVIVDDQRRLLMVQRAETATKPGLWCIPAGFMDYGEDVRAAAARELVEETGFVAEIGSPIFVASNFHDPEKLTVGIWFQGEIVGGELSAGDDASDVGWFSLDDLPQLAFETDGALIAGL